jgi:hypothetical protein
MLAAIRGQPTDQIPWGPRFDLWYIALRTRGALPAELQDRNTAELADIFDVGCHGVRGDYTMQRPPKDLALRAYGLENHPDFPFRVELRDLPMEFESDDENIETTIETKAGTVHTHLRQSKSMTSNGISLPFVLSYPIQSTDDLDAVAEVFEHVEVVPTPDAYDAFHERIGDRGLAVAGGPLVSCPMHLILHDLTPMDKFFYLYHDAEDELREFCRRITPFFEACLEAVAQSSAEAVFWGANYDQDLTWPPFFEREIAPWLRKVSDRLHAAAKHLLTHTDGENRALLPFYPNCSIDVAESVCPSPMTSCTLPELRAGMGDKTTIWGGVPSISLLEKSMDDRQFESYLDEMFENLGTGERLILGVSDNVPPDAVLSRLDRIKARIEAFGPVRPSGNGGDMS